MEDLARRIVAGGRVELPDPKLDHETLLPTIRKLDSYLPHFSLEDCFDKVVGKSRVI